MATDGEASLKAEAGAQVETSQAAAGSTQPPDGPEPVNEEQRRKWSNVTTTGLIAGGGGLVLLSLVVAGSAAPTMGATRSARLRFEQRQELVRQAAQQDMTSRQKPSAGE